MKMTKSHDASNDFSCEYLGLSSTGVEGGGAQLTPVENEVQLHGFPSVFFLFYISF